MLMVEFSVTPLDRGVSIAGFTSEAIEMVSRSGLKYRVGPMGTTIEGEIGDVMALIAECLTGLSQKSERVIFSVQGDLRHKTESQMQHAIDRVEEILGQDLPQ